MSRRAIFLHFFIATCVASCTGDGDRGDDLRDGGSGQRDGEPFDRDAGPAARDGGPSETDGGRPDGSVSDGGNDRACVNIQADTVLALDAIGSVERTGMLTSNGMPLPPNPRKGDRGLMFFRGQQHATSAFRRVSESGPFTYAVDLVPDVYDIDFVGTSCGLNDTALCGRFALADGMSIEAAGNTDFEIPRVRITGTVSSNGAPLPDTTPEARGRILFTSSDPNVTHDTAFDLGTSGVGTYAIDLAPGTYDVLFVGTVANCARTDIPCSASVVQTDVVIAADQTLDIDLLVAVVDVTVTQNGQPMAMGTFSRGQIVLLSEAPIPQYLDVPGQGAATFTMAVVPGTYEVRFRGLNGSPEPTLPIGEATILPAVTITGDQALTVDLTTVRVTGAVTVDGQALPNTPAGENRGRIVFDDPTAPESRAATEIILNGMGAFTYDVTLLAATYDVRYTTFACRSPLPCVSGVVLGARALTTDQTLTIDLQTHRLSGAVTINGSPFPDITDSRGNVTLYSTTTSGTVPLGTTGPAGYDVRLLAGDYRVTVEPPRRQACLDGRTPGLPCSEADFGITTVAADAIRDLDIETSSVSGHVTVEGAALPTTGNGILWVYTQRGQATPYAVASDGRYAFEVPNGTYDIEWAPGDLCEMSPISGPRPCARHYLRRCE